MTFDRAALGVSESADLVKTLASPGFDILMRLLRASREYHGAKVGEITSGMSEEKFGSPEKLSSEIYSEAVQAREFAVAIRLLEELSTTDRDSFIEYIAKP